jgi:hypothetical protein
MQKQILQELKELKAIISKLIGTSDLPAREQFSQEAILKAGKEFLKLSIERNDWVKDHDIHRYIKNAHYRAGTFIRQEFGFSNYFKRGHDFYFNRKDLIALDKELRKRNVNLGKYMDFIEDKAKFKKSLEMAKENKKAGKNKKAFQLPYDLNDITSSPPKAPSVDVIKEDIERLKQEFFQYNLSDYIDIYKDNHAMMKFIYHFEKYLEPGLKRRCKRWCENFNYANHALELITNKKEVFIPVKEEDMIQL